MTLGTSPGVTAQVRTSDGWALQHGVLTVTDTSGCQVGHCVADTEGTVSIDPLPPGHYTAIFTAADTPRWPAPLWSTPTARHPMSSSRMARISGTAPPPAGAWTVEPAHSSIDVTARHPGISSIRGRLTNFGGRLDVTDPVGRSAVRAHIQAASIDTGNPLRDEHLRPADFLHVGQHQTIEFASTTLRQSEPDPWWGTRAVFHATTELRREDFALTYNQVPQAGIAAIGATLRMELDMQAVQSESSLR